MKNIFFLLIVVLLLSGCNPSAEGDVTWYSSYDIDTFVADWKDAQSNPNTEYEKLTVNADNGDSPNLTVPRIVNDNIRFASMHVNYYSCFYYYVLSGHEIKHDNVFNNDSTVRVTIHKQRGFFEAVLNKYNLTAVDGVAYHKDDTNNSWYIHNDGYMISVEFPLSLTFGDTVDIFDYFSFELVSGE